MIAAALPIRKLKLVGSSDDYGLNRLKHKLEVLMDHLIRKINEEPLVPLTNNLLEQLFELRIDILQWLVNTDQNPVQLITSLSTTHQNNLLPKKLVGLNNALAESLDLYKKVTLQFFNASENTIEIRKYISDDKINYATVRLFSQTAPGRNIFHWLNSSLRYEAAIFISELILDSKITMSEKEIDEKIQPFLESSILNYGAYSILTEYYNPIDYHLDQRINKMYILASKLELENSSRRNTLSLDDFSSYLNN